MRYPVSYGKQNTFFPDRERVFRSEIRREKQRTALNKPKRVLRSTGQKSLDSGVFVFPCGSCSIKGLPVPPEGYPGGVMFIGMYPGPQEERKGRPFAGKSGKLLRETLEEIGFKDEEMWFSNILKCRLKDEKGEQRDPTIQEMKQCGRFCLEEIKEVTPKLIVLMGDTPLKYFFNKPAVSKFRGMTLSKGDYKFFITYNPAYVDRQKEDSEDRNFWKRDLKTVFDLFKGVKKSKNENVEKLICLTYEDVDRCFNRLLSEVDRYVLDIESWAPGNLKEKKALDPWAQGFIVETVSFSFYSGDKWNAFCVPLEHPESKLELVETLKILKAYFEKLKEKGIKLIGQNIKWDLKVLEKHFGLVVEPLYFDTMVAHSLLSGKKSGHSLERMSIDYLGVDSYKEVIRQQLVLEKLAPLNELADMNMDDCINTLKLEPIFEKGLESIAAEQRKSRNGNGWDIVRYHNEIIIPGLTVLKKAELRGIPADLDYVKDLESQLESEIISLKEKIFSYPELFGKQDLKLTSPYDLNEILFDLFKFAPLSRKNFVGYSVDKAAFSQLNVVYKHPVLTDIQEFTLLTKLKGTYVTPYIKKHIKSDGRVHGKFNQHIAMTGRLSGEDPNLQNLPVRIGDLILKIFKVSDGWYVLYADFCLSGDTKIECLGGSKTISEVVSEINSGKELYSYCYRFDKDRIGLSKIVAGKKTGVGKEVWEVKLDNGEKVVATPEHPFMLSNGQYIRLQNLKPGDSLMPFYSKFSKKDKNNKVVYRSIKTCSAIGGSSPYISEHRLVALDIMGYTKETLKNRAIHHVDGCGVHNLPSNLRVMPQSEHFSVHRKLEPSEKVKPTRRGKWTQSLEGKKVLSKLVRNSWAKLSDSEREWRGDRISDSVQGTRYGRDNANWRGGKVIEWRCHYCGRSEMVYSYTARRRKYCNVTCYHLASRKTKPYVSEFRSVLVSGHHCNSSTGKDYWVGTFTRRYRKSNHKVVSISKLGVSDVFNITVEGSHNFALSAGVVVKNSQMELRVVSSYARDLKMMEAWEKDIDIHSQTYSEMYGIPLEEVTKRQREEAKGINFGIIYGMQDEGLAEALGIDVSEAHIKRETYLNTYSGIRGYMDDRIKEYKSQGYVETLFKRRIYISGRDEGHNERRAINSPIQGTASDINQLAAIELDRIIESRKMRMGLMDLIHDSLVYEVPEDELEDAKKLIKDTMEGLKLDFMRGVPLKVAIGVGKSLGDAKV